MAAVALLQNAVRIAILLSILIVIGVFVLVMPIAQDPTYHEFVDQRRILGIANFWNVVSNLPFLYVGLYGLMQAGAGKYREPLFIRLYSMGMILICAGSSWYHLEPTNSSLVWDRGAMTISFMTAFAFVLVRVTSPAWAARLLWPLLAIGLFSVIYWDVTESAGRGDLRLYALVQFLPGLIIPAFLLTMPERFGAQVSRWIWLGLIAYMLAKFAEWQDAAIYALGGLLSGHSIKHAIAAVSGYYFLRALMAAEKEQLD